MKIRPASVQFRANVGFSLNCRQSAYPNGKTCPSAFYKSIAGMYALTALLLSNLYYAISIKICGCISEVYSIRGAQGVLRVGVWVRVEGRRSNAIF